MHPVRWLVALCLLSSAACSEGTASVSSEMNPVGGNDAGQDPMDGDGNDGDGKDDEGPRDDGDQDGEDGQPDGDGEDGTSVEASCGDSLVEGDERCDDANASSGDGCNASCQIEQGWACPMGGLPCVPAACGDGIVAGYGAFGEECDDNNAAPLDGCSRDCQVEDGWICNDQGCHRVVCGDGVVEGDEGCEDGNDDPFDSCVNCQVRPSCGQGACAVVCGDGLIFPSEECDDGNALDGDGCSALCTLETGFHCTIETSALGDSLIVPAVYRDFAAHVHAGYDAFRHPDFYDTVGTQGISYGMVADTLDANGHPVYTGLCEKGVADVTACKASGSQRWQTHSKALFDQWYQGGELASIYVSTLELTRTASGRFSFDSGTAGFFPVDNAAWVRAGVELVDPGCSGGHNFGFTSEVRDTFTFRGGESLTFSGDDDVWVFIGGKLALDLGGVHGSISASITLGIDGRASCSGGSTVCVQPIRDLGLTVGSVYEIALFHAERRGCGSNFRLDLSGFERAKTNCEEVCGDGIVTPGEECDDANTLDTDRCSNECTINVIPD